MKKGIILTTVLAFAGIFAILGLSSALVLTSSDVSYTTPSGNNVSTSEEEVVRGIESIEKTSSDGNVDTYTITYSDGTTSTFTVTNGEDGSQGIQGEKGEDGHTPTITIGTNGNWFIDGVDSGVSAQGEQGEKGDKGDKGDTGATGADGKDGADGTSIRTGNGAPDAALGQDGDSYVDLSSWNYYVKENGVWNLKGNIKGDTGSTGENGNGIVSIEKSLSDGNVDTYIITYTDGTTDTFTVTNGEDGAQGIQGEKGEDGHTPVITIGENGNWFIDGVDSGVSSKGEKGDKGDTGNGIVSIEKTDTNGNVDTYTITYTDGTTDTFTITNGTDGAQGEQGIQGEPGEDGHTPVITIGENGNWFIDGVDSGVAAQGEKGDKGDQGDAGADGTSMLTGTGAPDATLGNDGDSYIDLSSWDYYVKANGIWTQSGNIKGATGDSGAAGEDAPHAGETFTVTYHLNSGTMPAGYEEVVTVGWGDVLDLPIPTYYGHVFDGWFTGETVNDKQFYSTDAVFTNLELYAHWSVGTYTISFNLNGGSYNGETSMNPITIHYGETYTLPIEGLTYEGYDFMGWYDGTTRWEENGTYNIDSSITLTAKWEILVTYNLTINLNGGTMTTEVPTSITNGKLNRRVPIETPTKTGFDFLGYYIGGMRLTDENGLVTNKGILSTSNSVFARYVATDGSATGDYVYFGEYPQSEVTDSTLLTQLANATDSDGDSWVDYNGKEYAKLSNRYFEVEPILWEVRNGGELISSMILDTKQYYRNVNNRNYQGATIYANNYLYSNVRAFLNGENGSAYGVADYSNKGFYNLAFNDTEKAQIQTSEVNNSASTTYRSPNSYICVNTNDPIYLLSYQEAANYYSSDVYRMKEYTDYALANGPYYYNSTTCAGSWWLRSPYDSFYYSASYVYSGGYVGGNSNVRYALGLSPALKITQ